MARRIMLAIAGLFLMAGLAEAAEFDDALATIKSIKREGTGNEPAAAAWKIVVQGGPKAVPAILAAFEGADATAVNWLRSAIDAIADAEHEAGRKLSAAPLEKFVKDTQRDARARSLALEWLMQVDASAGPRLLPPLVNDPSSGVRREAVAHAIKVGDVLGTNSDEQRRAFYRKLFDSARDIDQVEAVAKKVKELGGGEVDVNGHLGLISRWELAGPFDNTGLKGYAAPLPKVEKWTEFATGHKRALVDLYPALGKAKGVKDNKKDAVYALCRTVIDSPTERTAEIRVASQNALKIFLNGQEVFAREEYHHGFKLDQHIARVTLKQGRNEIMLKVCQDAMTFEWTVKWDFQCRVCDEIGGAVPFTVLTATKAVPVVPMPDPKEKQ